MADNAIKKTINAKAEVADAANKSASQTTTATPLDNSETKGIETTKAHQPTTRAAPPQEKIQEAGTPSAQSDQAADL